MGYSLISSLSPPWKEWFLHGIGSAMITWVASDTPAVQTILISPLARYLGRIAFALYLVHHIVIHVVSMWLIPCMWMITGKDTTLGFELGFFLAMLIHVPITFFVADLFTKLIIGTSLKFTKWLESKLSIGVEF
jgi:peptidoglycan/LPS O-acetylase OafA/YrhL